MPNETKAAVTHLVTNPRLSESVLANDGYWLGRHVARRHRSASVERCMSILIELAPGGPWEGRTCSMHGGAACHRSLTCHVEVSEVARYLSHPATVAGVRRGVELVRSQAARATSMGSARQEVSR